MDRVSRGYAALGSSGNLPCRLQGVWTGDWREALEEYGRAASGYRADARAVYIDPPYGKMQYSRYYHVLNALIDYKYPICSGSGRCLPRNQRFSSRFEYQPRVAAREFGELLQACRARGLITIVSYSDKGFVPIRAIVEQMEVRFSDVSVYSARMRHHFQGRKSPGGSDEVHEYLLVGTHAKPV